MMIVTTVYLEEEQIAAVDERARKLSKEYGVSVSRSEVVRRALNAFFTPAWSTDSPMDEEKTSDVSAA